MAQFPCLPIWTDSWGADTDHLSFEEEGVYFRLVRVMWRAPNCRVPNDDQWLAKHLRVSLEEVVEKVRPVIAEFCTQDGNWLYQKRLKREYVRRFELSAAQSARAKSRWRKKKGSTQTDATNGSTPPGNASLNLPFPPKKASFSTSSSFPTAATEKQEENPARSFATASNGDALAREPDSEPAEGKRVADKKPETLAEVNELWYGIRR